MHGTHYAVLVPEVFGQKADASAYTLNGVTASDAYVMAGYLYLEFVYAGVLPKASTPNAYFNATGSDTGTLTNVYEGMTYQIGDGEPVAITSSTVNLTGLAPCEIKIVNKGVDGVSTDSDPQVITVTRGFVPETVVMVPCSTAANDDGCVTGTDSYMDYKVGDGEWTRGPLYGVFSQGTVIKVRMRPRNDTLTSDEKTFTIASYTKITELNITYEDFEEPAAGESVYRPNNFVTGEGYTLMYNLSTWRHKGAVYWDDFKNINANEASDVFAADTDYRLMLRLKANIGYYFDEEIANSYTFNGLTPVSASAFGADEIILSYVIPSKMKTGEISVSLNENFKMNFYVDLTEEELAKARVVYTFLGNEYEGTPRISGFSFDGIAPQYIGETLNARLYIDDFLAYEAECSIKSYLEAVTAKYPSDSALQTLANDILVYGGAAQTYTSYKTGELVSEDVPGTTFVPLDDSYGNYALENNGEYVKFTGATVYFDDIVSLKVKFKKTSEEPFEMVYGGDTVDYVKSGDDYIITVPVVAGSITGGAATFAVNKTGGAAFTYGVGNYVYAMQGRDDAMGKLAKALWNYGLAAAAYTS